MQVLTNIKERNIIFAFLLFRLAQGQEKKKRKRLERDPPIRNSQLIDYLRLHHVTHPSIKRSSELCSYCVGPVVPVRIQGRIGPQHTIPVLKSQQMGEGLKILT